MKWRFVLLLSVLLSTPIKAGAEGVNYSGGRFSQIPVLSMNSAGKWDWNLLDLERSGSSSFTRSFGGPGSDTIIANWLYKKVTSAGVVSAPTPNSRGRLVWTIKTKVTSRGQSRTIATTKFLGRRGELLLTGGDFNGNGIADAVVVKSVGGHWKWGLRADFFLTSYNPTLHANRAYFTFGSVGADIPFFLNPDGKSDWFGLLSSDGNGGCNITLKQPFTKATKVIHVGAIPDAHTVPIPVRQSDSSDLMMFYGVEGENTRLIFKDLSGATIDAVTIPLIGAITVGNYGSGAGEEVAVSSNGTFVIYNPITRRREVRNGPVGQAVDGINILTVY